MASATEYEGIGGAARHDKTSRGRSGGSRRNWRGSLTDTWLLEYVALITSLAATLAIIGILVAYNGQDITTWSFPANISINAVISAFSTVAKGFLAIAVSAALGQWKWIWLSKHERRLDDFESIDSASRGPWGSFKMLLKSRGNIPLVLGTLITILSIAVDPFVQQILSIQVENVALPENAATIAIAQSYQAGNLYLVQSAPPQIRVAYIDFAMEAAILQGLSQTPDSIVQQMPFVCSTGNCTWPGYTSMGICSTCNNVTTSIKKTGPLDTNSQWLFFFAAGAGSSLERQSCTNYSLPDGNAIWNADDADRYYVSMTTRINFDQNQSLGFSSDDLMLASMTIMRANFTAKTIGDWPNVPVNATECALSFCVKQYNSSAVNGKLIENAAILPAERGPGSFAPLDTSKHDTTTPSLGGILNQATYENRSDLQVRAVGQANNTYNVTQQSIDGIVSYLSDLFNVNSSAMLLTGQSAAIQPQSSSIQALWNSANLTDSFDALALAMSNQLRQSSPGSPVQQGIVLKSTAFIRVRWGWATLPVALLLLGCIFLSLSVWESRRARIPVWKESALPILYHGIVPHQGQVAQLRKASEMKERAKTSTMKFTDFDGVLALRSKQAAYYPFEVPLQDSPRHQFGYQ